MMRVYLTQCYMQITLYDPYLSALGVRYYNKGAI